MKANRKKENKEIKCFFDKTRGSIFLYLISWDIFLLLVSGVVGKY
jgi:hypothetical protein